MRTRRIRIDIQDPVGRTRSITSKNARIIGDWFAEHARELMSADVREYTQIRIWPESQDEFKLIGPDPMIRFTQDGLLYLAEKILDASKQLADARPSPES